jgi:mRNA interferase RelE/StbE
MYSVYILRRAMTDITGLPQAYARRVVQQVDALGEKPRPPDTKKLQGDGGYRLRVGIYRILYDVDDKTRRVTVYRVKHRREAYR